MRIRIKAQAGSLKAYTQALKKLGSAKKINDRFADAAVDQIHESFDTGTDSHGSPWEPTKLRAGRPLHVTGSLEASYSAKGTGTGIQIQSSAVSANVHQHGATIRAKNVPYLRFQVGGRWFQVRQVTIPARPVLPEGDLGPRWEGAFNDALDKLAKELLGGF